MRPLLPLGGVLLAASYLLPSTERPWPSFWREWVAGCALIVLFAWTFGGQPGPQRYRVPAAALLSVSLAVSAWAQLAAGSLNFLSDAVLVSGYLLGFAAAIVGASNVEAEGRRALIRTLCLVWLAAAVVSTPIALLQWLRVLPWEGVLSTDLPHYGGRPVAQLGQSNMLCLLMLLGLASLLRLYEEDALPAGKLLLLVPLLTAGAALTQSRLAWVAYGTAPCFWWLLSRRAAPRIRTGWFVAAAALFAALSALVLSGNYELGLGGTALAERMSGGRRPDAWRLFLNAVFERPWTGWGWLQTGNAQISVALQHPPLAWYFSSSHNQFLDLALWCGIPIAIGVAGFIVVGGARLCTSTSGGTEASSLLAIVFVLLHAMVEFPLLYGNILWPLGFWLGIHLGKRGSASSVVHLPGVPFRIGSWLILPVGAALLGVLARDVRIAQEIWPTTRIAHVAERPILYAEPSSPQILLMDSLQAFHDFAAQSQNAALSPETYARMHSVRNRYPYPEVLEHYAWVLSRNGGETEAIHELQLACRFQSATSCAELLAAWSFWRGSGNRVPALP
ncbi:MAG: Wzy polymerase domain-containing protein [Pseudomonadota bacterium]